MFRSYRMPLLFLVCAVLVFNCSRKRESGGPLLLVLGSDTITAGIAAELDPVGTTDSIRFVHAGIRTLLATANEKRSDTLGALFADRLQLVSGTEWTAKSAATLFNAAEALAATPVASGECGAITTLADSLATIIGKAPKQGFTFKPESSSIVCDEASPLREKQLAALALVLGINNETARLCHDFVFKAAEQPVVNEQQTKKMISGLLSGSADTAKPGSQKASPSPAGRKELRKEGGPVLENVNVLAFRKEQSIRDTITKHIPTLQQLYKKGLKTNALMAGTVIVAFSVTPAGSVESAQVKTTAISDAAFLKNLCSYLRQVRFQPVPEKAGMMYFDFPFEFNPEM